MPIISLSKVTKAFGTQLLVENATLAVNAGDRIGVVGANGTGKTTLLRLIAGADEPTSGEVHVARSTRIGYLSQEPDFSGHGTVLEAAMSAFDRVHEIEARIAEIHDRLADEPPDSERLLREQGDLEHEFERLGGYTIRQRGEAVLAGLGFKGKALQASVERLSGGERSRLAIAHLLLQEPDVLLLDEPTNHLDIDGLQWLEGFLGSFGHATIVVSHDRSFLNTFAQRVFDIEGTQVDVYRGNYESYVVQKAERMVQRRKAYDTQQAWLKREADFIQRYIAGQRGKEAKGRRKRMERVERLDAPTEHKEIHVRITPAVRSGTEVLSVNGLGKSFGDRALFEGLDLQVLRGERIGILGPNGSGKTSLLRIIIGEDDPTCGKVRFGHNVQAGYYRQDRNDLNPDLTILDQVWTQSPLSRAGELRSLLGLFLFSEDDVFKHVGDLSGGEQARVALAKLILSAPNLLVLDEPTNHLDIPSRQALENALNAYEGTVLLVSHDRYVLERVADKIVEIKDGQARIFQGSYSYYADKLRAEAAEASGVQATAARKRRPGGKPQRAGGRRKPRPIHVVEKLIFEREEAVKNLEHAMSDPEIYKSPDTGRTLGAQLEGIRHELAGLYDEWDDAAETVDESEA